MKVKRGSGVNLGVFQTSDEGIHVVVLKTKVLVTLFASVPQFQKLGFHKEYAVYEWIPTVFYAWVGGNIEWIPTVRYFGGFKMVFRKVDKERFYYVDLSKMYEKSGGKCTNLTVYYCLPGQPLDSGIRKLEGDNDILDLLRAYKGENVVPIYIEELDEQYDADSENQFTENIDDENPDNENNVNEEVICENIDTENPLTENFVLQNDVSGIPDTENSVFENLGAENQFTENIDIENPDNENNVENPLTENIEIENPLTKNSILENVVNENPDTENPEIQNPVTENPLTENMDEEFFEQLYNDENLINEAVDLNNEFKDGAWASVSDEDGQNEEGVGGSDSSSVSDCPSWMLEVLEGPDDDDIFQERPPDHAKKLFKALRSFLKDKKRQRVEAQLEKQEEGWYSDVEEENEDDLDALRGSDEEGERYAVWNDDMEKRGVDLFVGLQLATRKKYKEVLKDWVVRRGWDLKFLKSERDKVTTICKNGCDWRIHASPVMKTSTYHIKSRENTFVTIELTTCKQTTNILVECSMHKVYRAKRYALELLRADVKEQYNRLYDYCATVVKDNPNSSMVLKVNRSLALPLIGQGKVTSLVTRKDVILATHIEEAMMKNESLESLSIDSIKRDQARSRVNEQKDRNAKMVRVSSLKKKAASTKPNEIRGKAKKTSVAKSGKLPLLSKGKKTVFDVLKKSKSSGSSTWSSRGTSYSGKKKKSGNKNSSAVKSPTKLNAVGFRGRSAAKAYW
ncbi:hypothetical protein BUALT_BualtUnG0027200 [Buddleja alternifolia]|uniref:Transposase MuDR plant domain-containing protein n=1 Tax=Buddleja alternifolia TaxID=168488 RepID=A0AAV6W189_9LAMI|nr:hypothetical protein BUALT_BualtUnG0027200 [Buddleja alternifolia]